MKRFLVLLALLLSTGLHATPNESAPPGHITLVQIGADELKHYMSYSHYHIIGICSWLYFDPWPTVDITEEVDEYLPDLVVTVYNDQGDDPWIEANTIDDKVSNFLGSHLIQWITGFASGEGNISGTPGTPHYGNLRAKRVDVIGNPDASLFFPEMNLRIDTKPYTPYYRSITDILGRLGIAELIRPETYDPLKYYIGDSAENKWGYEFPRNMSVAVDSDYKASVIVALHAADIVTNKNALHVVKSTSDSCGRNCAVANVIEETSDKNELWEEVYPADRHIQLGQDDLTDLESLGESDDNAGNGNYVFLVWRHYKGCIQGEGSLMWSTVHVPGTKKR